MRVIDLGKIEKEKVPDRGCFSFIDWAWTDKGKEYNRFVMTKHGYARVHSWKDCKLRDGCDLEGTGTYLHFILDNIEYCAHMEKYTSPRYAVTIGRSFANHIVKSKDIWD